MSSPLVCADDYGLAPGVDRAIRELVADRRLDATSVMTVFDDFDSEIAALLAAGGASRIGLHFTLTDYRPLGPMKKFSRSGRLPSMARLLMRAYARQVDGREIAAELERQFDRLATALGRKPDFIDGHKHVQVLPIVRDVVLTLARRHNVPVRMIELPVGIAKGALPQQGKATMLGWMGRRLAAEAGDQALNRGFLGVRSFSPSESYRALFRRWLAVAPPGSLIMCHPGIPDETLAARDCVTTTRAGEFAYLAGPGYLADRAEYAAKRGA
ncbi:MAG: ChbG/HpnK family deacetylase [Hypericibacter sp.]